MRISDWSSDVCSSDLVTGAPGFDDVVVGRRSIRGFLDKPVPKALIAEILEVAMRAPSSFNNQCWNFRSEEHTSELQSLMRISYAVFCLTKTKTTSLII